MTGPGIVAWLAGEVFDLSLGEALGRVMRRRAEGARHILQEELSRAQINVADAADKDEAAAMVFEYTEAARQGAARRNLRMLAQIMAGQLVTPPIYANDFLRWSRIVADLSREEIIVIAAFHREFEDPPPSHPERTIFRRVADSLTKSSVVRSGDDLEAVVQGLSRTGLFIQQSGATGGAMAGGTIYVPSPRLSDLMKLVNIEEVLGEPDR
jgi:hypothetical protein